MDKIKIIVDNSKKDQNVADLGCMECQSSCQSACKTSCTVGNQNCLKQEQEANS